MTGDDLGYIRPHLASAQFRTHGAPQIVWTPTSALVRHASVAKSLSNPQNGLCEARILDRRTGPSFEDKTAPLLFSALVQAFQFRLGVCNDLHGGVG